MTDTEQQDSSHVFPLMGQHVLTIVLPKVNNTMSYLLFAQLTFNLAIIT